MEKVIVTKKEREFYKKFVSIKELKNVSKKTRYSFSGIYKIMVGKTSLNHRNVEVIEEIRKVAVANFEKYQKLSRWIRPHNY